MAEHIIIGIDIGGSTTKIVGFDTSAAEKTLIRPLLVRATDPITSIYGAFGKFLDQNGLTLGDVQKVMFTGAGSSYMSKPIYGLPSEKIAEFKSIGLGGLYLSGLERAIIASCGTGTALVYAEEGAEPDYLGGTGVGGGTLVGLSKKMLNMDNVDHIAELAKSGSLDRVDLKIKDITKTDIVPGFSDIMTASNFGQVSDLATRADIACGIINMVFETIGMISIFAARNYKIRDVVLTGNLSQVPQAEAVFETLNRMFDMNFIIPENSAFGTVIGAALAGLNS
ncbi:MAG: type II pantothenate kinase [Clostridia bacterium]|nr:type II pantothenate kinase [Clostridia bacterium]MCR4906882.1 type II pantothenate kinase [Clostridiales bacterium]